MCDRLHNAEKVNHHPLNYTAKVAIRVASFDGKHDMTSTMSIKQSFAQATI